MVTLPRARSQGKSLNEFLVSCITGSASSPHLNALLADCRPPKVYSYRLIRVVAIPMAQGFIIALH